jgi:nitrite reductase (NADH) large subunit
MADTARAKKITDGMSLPAAGPIPLRRRKLGSGTTGPTAAAPFGRLVIVGNGMVSRSLCEQLLRSGAGRELPEIVVFGAESRPAYDRVHLGEVLSGRPPESLLLSPPSWYLASGIRLHLGDPVVRLDLEAQQVISARGHRLRYDRLVLATGASPVIPSMIADPHEVFFLRTLDDVERLRDRMPNARRAAVIGGGLLGVETAAALCQAGLKVTVVEMGAHLMRRQLDPATAEALRRMLVTRGVDVVMGHKLSTVATGPTGRRVILSEGVEVLADLVVVATGVRPRDQLGGAALARHALGGYLIDERLRTSVPQVYAIGDCAAMAGLQPGTVLPGYQMAEKLAPNLLGPPQPGARWEEQPFVPLPPSIRLKLPGSPLLLAGQCPPGGWTARLSLRGGYRALAVRDGKLVAAAALGSWSEWNRVESAVMNREPVTSKQLRRFARGGDLWPAAMKAATAVVSGDAIVCVCNLVSMRSVQTAISDGCRTVADVAGRTRACSGCGSCTPVVLSLLEGQQTAPVVRPMRALWPVGLATLLLASLPLAALAPGLRARWLPASWDFLFRDPAAQQITGFGLVALALIAMLLPLRRKLAARMPGSGNFWRLIHGLVGVMLLAGVLVHSSGRVGQGLNGALSVATLALTVAGAALALGWRRAPPQPAPVRRVLRPLHLLLLWPALGLMLAHVLAVYYF